MNKSDYIDVGFCKKTVFYLFLCLTAFSLSGNAWATDIAAVESKADAANSKADGNRGVIQALETEIILLRDRIDNLPSPKPGPPGPPGQDRTADLCALYHNLYDSALIGELTIPTYCNNGEFHHIGGLGPAGGIVFYVDETGTAVGTGAQNTLDILADECNLGASAAAIASAYSLNSYNNWFLPSHDELHLLFLVQDVVGGFSGFSVVWGEQNYWSSTESTEFTAFQQQFHDADPVPTATFKAAVKRVRAIREF